MAVIYKCKKLFAIYVWKEKGIVSLAVILYKSYCSIQDITVLDLMIVTTIVHEETI